MQLVLFAMLVVVLRGVPCWLRSRCARCQSNPVLMKCQIHVVRGSSSDGRTDYGVIVLVRWYLCCLIVAMMLELERCATSGGTA